MQIDGRKIGAIFCILGLFSSSARATPDILTDGAAAVYVDGSIPVPGIVTAGSATTTFENFSEGDHFKPSFTDPVSGIFFSDSTAANGNFVIEYSKGSNWPSPMFQDNKYMTGNGYAPGDGASMAAQFGFTATLPQLVRTVELDLAGSRYEGTYTVSLIAQSGNGVTLGSQSVDFTSTLPTQYHLRVDSASTNIAKFQIVTGTNGFDGVDNITISVPEPSVGFVGAVVLVLVLGRTHLRGREAGKI